MAGDVVSAALIGSEASVISAAPIAICRITTSPGHLALRCARRAHCRSSHKTKNTDTVTFFCDQSNHYRGCKSATDRNPLRRCYLDPEVHFYL